MVTQKVEEYIKEREEQDKKISDKFKYTEEDMEEIVAKAVKDQIKEKDLFKENVVKTAREIAGMMGLKLDNIDFGVSGVNKDRQTVLFQEIQKANAKQMVDNSSGKSSDEKIGQKRVNKEGLSRGTISSEGTEDDSESETSEINLEGKKKVTGGGKSKKGRKSGKSKKKSKKGWIGIIWIKNRSSSGSLNNRQDSSSCRGIYDVDVAQVNRNPGS
ncbi:hypothetical protein RhiirA1_521693 [Rhizophagus irregularis]|uniref:Uncharacterized protein n=1 Tax=Rhizophagus irregularis TaxID=588596 RepID=A0A2I1DR24_9GLOM|nr:hypothetical protein RhiirA1_521693 [Rhizophagus irregularis]PKY12333.1 hypothetical protein RhiirB3_488397 [Rhizophagus irregularis]